MKSNMNYTAIDDLSITDIAELPIATLAEFQSALNADGDKLKERRGKMKAALDSKYAERAQITRVAQKKDSGRVAIPEGEFVIFADGKKNVKWDQSQLAEIAARIIASGENPASYMRVEYGVLEANYKVWPENIKKAFDVARTVVVEDNFKIEPAKK